MSRVHAAPYQATVRTLRGRGQVLDDLASLAVPGANVSERGDTYLVFVPHSGSRYGPGRATAIAAIVVLAALLATASNVLWILVLPGALLAYVPLLIEDHAMLAIGAVDDDEDGVARITVHGHAWGELQGAVDAYMGHLPTPPEVSSAREGDAPASGADGGDPPAPPADGRDGAGPTPGGGGVPDAGATLPARRHRSRAAR